MFCDARKSIHKTYDFANANLWAPPNKWIKHIYLLLLRLVYAIFSIKSTFCVKNAQKNCDFKKKQPLGLFFLYMIYKSLRQFIMILWVCFSWVSGVGIYFFSKIAKRTVVIGYVQITKQRRILKATKFPIMANRKTKA